MICGGCKSTASKLWILFFTLFFLLTALILGLLWPQLALGFVNKQLVLEEGSQNYDNWKVTPIPMYLEIFMFNWTNADEVENHNVKPNFAQMGPYVFEEKHTRTNIQWNDNHTVSFQQIRVWHFAEEKSNGSLDDEITSLNVIPVTVAYSLRDYPSIMKTVVSAMMQDEIAPLMHTKTVRELLFDGYDDKFLDLVKSINRTDLPQIPFDRFGWFVERNGSETFDGHFTMFTGSDDISQLGVLDLWNGKNETGYFRDKCNVVHGTTGELWPPMRNQKENVPDISLFATDLCRTITLSYDSKDSRFGITGNRWIGDDRVFDNGRKYPEASCWCTAPLEQCPDLHPGVTSISSCKFGAPVFASYPHFYLADKYYLSGITGLSPSKEEHEFSLLMEPSTGIPLDVRAQLQINLLLQPIAGFKKFDNVPTLMIPMIWFRQDAKLTEELAGDAKLAVMLPSIGMWVAYGLAGIGVVILFASLGIAFFARRNSEEQQELLS